MLLSNLLVLLPLVVSGVFSAAIASPDIDTRSKPDEAYELTVKFGKRDIDLAQLPAKVAAQLEALGLDGTKGVYKVNGVELHKRDVMEALAKRKGPDEAYELTIKF